MPLDPTTAIAVFELIESTINVGAKIADLIHRAKSGEVIPLDEIQADREELDRLVDQWERTD